MQREAINGSDRRLRDATFRRARPVSDSLSSVASGPAEYRSVPDRAPLAAPRAGTNEALC